MRKSQDWQDYRLIDASDGQRLEKWGGITLVRPDPQIIWKNPDPLAAVEQGGCGISPFIKRRRKLGIQKTAP